MTNKQVAELMRGASEDYKSDFLDSQNQKMIEEDVEDLAAVAKLIDYGALKEALRAAEFLDTIVRDYVPNSVFEFLQENS